MSGYILGVEGRGWGGKHKGFCFPTTVINNHQTVLLGIVSLSEFIQTMTKALPEFFSSQLSL